MGYSIESTVPISNGKSPVVRAVQNFRKRLQACVFKAGGHFEHFNVTDFMLMCLRTRFPSSILEYFT